MNDSLSILELVQSATLVGQVVIAILLLGSFVSWIMIFQRWFSLSSIKRESLAFENEFWSGEDLGKLYLDLEAHTSDPIGMEHIFTAGFKEFSRSRKSPGSDPDRIMQNVQRAMRVAVSREEERLETNLSFLATVGSISVYIGLFGTVWGIMDTFHALAQVEQASLSIVGPGISEALFATELGLFAAIPAVMAYNRFSAQVEIIMNRFEAFTDEFSGILYRAIHTDG